VCRSWRQVFTSRSSLWTDLDCTDADKTRVYLERSKSSPINLSLYRDGDLSPCDPFFQIGIDAIVGRLRSLSIQGMPSNLQDITACLSRPATLLQDMSIGGNRWCGLDDNPVLASELFNGDLSSLHKLHLHFICTELPWKNMANLTSFALAFVSPISMRLLLDFFESAPNLHEVGLYSTSLISAAQNGRLVSLACLKRMYIDGVPQSALLDHLLIPPGACLTTEVNLPIPTTEGHPPRFLDNLRNLPDFTSLQFNGGRKPQIEFKGPNGEVCMYLILPQGETRSSLEYIAHFDTSKTEWLNIDFYSPPSSGPPHRTLLPMEDLQTLTLSPCSNPYFFIHALDPSMSPSGALVCPKLEEFFVEHREPLDIRGIVRMAAARASRGANLKSVRISDRYEQSDVLELKKYVSRVECVREVDGVGGDGGESEEGD